MAMAMAEAGVQGFARHRHVLFFLDMLEQLPSAYEGSDVNRATLAYFAVSALDLLDALPQVPAQDVIDWVYSLQVLPLAADHPNSSTINKEPIFGFRGSPSVGGHYSSNGATPILYDGGHLAATYSALSILRILGDDMSCVEHEAVVNTVRGLQQPDGRLHQKINEGVGGVDEKAAAICAILDDWRGMDVDKALAYILSCQSYDDGFGLNPGLEAHGGGTYCALASLKLMGRLPSKPHNDREAEPVILDRASLVGWCGRTLTHRHMSMAYRLVLKVACLTKLARDKLTLEAFKEELTRMRTLAMLSGSSLKILGTYVLCNKAALRAFLLTCQTKFGGFSKLPHGFPDLLHSYYGICAFSLLEEPGLQPLCGELGISMRAADGLPFLLSSMEDQYQETSHI